MHEARIGQKIGGVLASLLILAGKLIIVAACLKYLFSS